MKTIASLVTLAFSPFPLRTLTFTELINDAVKINKIKVLNYKQHPI